MADVSVNEVRPRNGFSGKQVFLNVLLTLLVSVVLTYFVLQRYVFAKEFEPVYLLQTEVAVLNEKIQALGFQPDTIVASNEPKKKKWLWGSGASKIEKSEAPDVEPNLIPEAYKEDSSKCEINFSEKKA